MCIRDRFHITGPESRIKFYEFNENRGVLKSLDVVSPYKLRKEQQEAVDQTVAYRNSHEQGEFLWNAKPRFGTVSYTHLDVYKRQGYV